MPPAHRGPLLSDIRAAQEAVLGGNISNSQTIALYTQWTALCTDLQLDHLIKDPNLPSVKILWVYGHWVCHGQYYS